MLGGWQRCTELVVDGSDALGLGVYEGVWLNPLNQCEAGPTSCVLGWQSEQGPGDLVVFAVCLR